MEKQLGLRVGCSPIIGNIGEKSHMHIRTRLKGSGGRFFFQRAIEW